MFPRVKDNYLANIGSVKGQGQIYGPTRKDAVGVSISTADVGFAAATILGQPLKYKAHKGKVYNITCPGFSQVDVEASFTKHVGKKVEYVQASLISFLLCP